MDILEIKVETSNPPVLPLSPIPMERVDPELQHGEGEGNMGLSKRNLGADDPQKLTIGTQDNMDSKLHRAAREGNMKLLSTTLEHQKGLDLTVSLTPQKSTVLHIAVTFGKEEMANKIIELCPSLISQPNSKGDTPLHLAAGAGHLSLTKLLTGGGVWRMRNSQGNRAIHEAVRRGHEEVAMHLLELEKGHELIHDVNGAGESHLYLAAEAGLEEFVKAIVGMVPHAFILQGPDRQTPLHIAVIRGHLGIVKLLLGADLELAEQVDRVGKTALHYAASLYYNKAEQGDRVEKTALHYAASLFYNKEPHRNEVLNRLLSANPSLAYVPDHGGHSPVLLAAIKGHASAIKEILDSCPDSAELVDLSGRNVFHLLVINNHGKMINSLSVRPELRTLINEPDHDGNTPMHLAAENNDRTSLKHLLLNEELDLAVTNNNGLTALDICGSGDLTKDKVKNYRDLKRHKAVHNRHQWQEMFSEKRVPLMDLTSDLKSMANTLSIVATLVAAITFAAGLTLPGGYKNDGEDEGLPVLLSKASLKAFIFADAVAFYTSIAVAVLLVRAFFNPTLLAPSVRTCFYFSGVAVIATVIAFGTGFFTLVSKESLWMAIFVLVMGCWVPFMVAYALLVINDQEDPIHQKAVQMFK